MLRIVLADDHSILRDGLRRGLTDAGEDVVGEAANGEEAVEVARSTRPDVVLMDLSMPVLDGIEATRRITAELPDTRVVVLSMHDDPTRTRAAINAGAVGFLHKGATIDEVVSTIRRAADGATVLSPELAMSMLEAAQADADTAHEPMLSQRQVQILQLIVDGRTTKQAAREVGITQKTVHNHLNAIYRRLDTQSLTHAVLSAVRLAGISMVRPGMASKCK